MRRVTHAELEAIRLQLQVAQKNHCGICDCSFTDAKLVKGKLVPKYKPALDHDHDTGVIRGVLCANCNGNEGRIKRRALSAKRDMTYLEWLKRMVDYLEHHSEPKTALLHPTYKTEDEQRVLRNKKARQRRAASKAAQILAEQGIQ